jgi:RNA 2',3'-cyclic 3'-phosphodiesterase
MGQRVFFALDIDEAVRGRIVASVEQLRSEPAKVNWTKPENLHVTMNFLGDLRDARIEKLREVVARSIGGWEPPRDEIVFSIEPLICFPDDRRPRMIWAPVAGGSDVLSSLHAVVNRGLADGGWPSESRPFKGHVTVGRIKSGDLRAAVEKLPAESLGTVRVSELTFYQSTLTPSGPIYNPLARIPLNANR